MTCLNNYVGGLVGNYDGSWESPHIGRIGFKTLAVGLTEQKL